MKIYVGSTLQLEETDKYFLKKIVMKLWNLILSLKIGK